MKKFLKIFGITFASIVALLIAVAAVACYVVFTPERLTPIVRNQADKYLTCETTLDTVNLTFFSTFPNFAIEVANLSLNEKETKENIAHISRLSAEVNLMKFLFKNSVIINSVELYGTKAFVHTDSLGNANYDIVYSSDTTELEEETDSSSSSFFDMMEISIVKINDLSARYIDETSNIDAKVDNLNLYLTGLMEADNANLNFKLNIDSLLCSISDSTVIDARINNAEMDGDIEMINKDISTNLHTHLPSLTFAMDGDTLANSLSVDLYLPAQWSNNELITIDNAKLAINDILLAMAGNAKMKEDSSIDIDMTADASEWDFDNIISLVPESYKSLLEDFRTLKGTVSMNAHATGTYNDSTMPLIAATMLIDNAEIRHAALDDYTLKETTADIAVQLDMNNEENSSANIRKIYTRFDETTVSAKGNVTDFMNNAKVDLDLLVETNLPDLKPLIPEDMIVEMSGRSSLDVHLNTTLDDLTNQNLDKITASGTINYKNLDVLYNDSIHLVDSKGTINLSLPATVKNRQFKPLVSLDITGTDMFVSMLGTMEGKFLAPQFNVTATDPTDTTKMLSAAIKFDMKNLDVEMDTIAANVYGPIGYASFMPSKEDAKKPVFTAAYISDSMNVKMGNSLDFSSDKIDIKAFSRYDKNGKNAFLQWNPALLVDFNNGNLSMSGFGSKIEIPEIKFKFTPQECNIENSKIVIDDSDFSLAGDITNIRNFIEKDDLLVGKLDFTSDNTNIDQLMDLVNGLGGSEEDEADKAEAENVDITKATDLDNNEAVASTEVADPFMVPKGVDITLNTNIKKAIFNDTELEDILGKLTVCDGRVVLEQIGFTAEAAEMQLGGIYRSDRRNHLFAGLDFHLLDIDIESLIDLIPDIDSIVPMLSSFEGTGEFHLVAQTYLKADYSPKISTLRGAAAFEGKDLVVLDNEIFSTISKYLMFNKKTRNVVDSLSVEMTVFRDEVDLYPFHISMDKWQAVLAGRHNLDMTFDYHISLTKCPLPVRLGLDVKGNFDDMTYKLVPCKYNEMYKPNREKTEMQKHTLNLKKVISDSLKERVK